MPHNGESSKQKGESLNPTKKKMPLQQSLLDILPQSEDTRSRKVFKISLQGYKDDIIPINGWDLFW